MQNMNIDTSEYLNLLKEHFDSLEETLMSKFNNHDTIKKTIIVSQYEEAIGLLTIEKSDLEQQLLEKQRECADWKNTCTNILEKLNKTIETIETMLRKVAEE